ncbi:hypothetical protein PHISCL_07078 [Aspergillus sclerotialis]|uniref:Uncharacterized protein n=1 Tax=Aspergillus sclerotialis TaxID=2070753 RepID=A0A3A2ZBT5_9EURO|nr:hypothetical protein PHISCL_07078 [Aspergillus sclerotialis]
MVQTYYPRPYRTIQYLGVQFLLAITGIIFWSLLGINSTPSLFAWMTFYTLQLGGVLFDPVICAITRTEDRGGVKVEVKRPLIGFRWSESHEPPEDVDVGVIHERAYLRI